MSAWARLRHKIAGGLPGGLVDSTQRAAMAPAPDAADKAEIIGHLAVVVEGFRGEALESILQTVTRTATVQRMKPVIVTTLGDLPFLRHVDLPLEAVWDVQPGRRDHAMLAIRLDQQLEAIVRLWRPFDVAAFTSPHTRYLADRLRAAIARSR